MMSASGWIISVLAVVVLAIAVFYDARGRRWTGWTSPGFWAAMTLILPIVAVPCYVLARGRTVRVTQRTSGKGPAAAGWYPDPGGDHDWRYWDGGTWTEHVARQRPS